MDKIQTWLKTTPYAEFTITVASADASFRKYYRLAQEKKSYILMDASLESDSLEAFIDITHRLKRAGVRAPKIYLQEKSLAYLILEDFGDSLLLESLNEQNFTRHYEKGINLIARMQNTETKNLPLYDKKFLHYEMNLMQEWYLEKKLRLSLSEGEQIMLHSTLNSISKIVLTQPQECFVHRDFHSRNIMLLRNGEIGIIDYQDAMSGALTYDLVSLLKDCYIEFSRQKIEKLALSFRDKKEVPLDDAEFLKYFDFMGLQRHIKVLGVFSRLFLRDNKEAYLKDIPLVLKYTIETASRYNETRALANFLQRVSQ